MMENVDELHTGKSQGSLLDTLVVVAENLKLLILIPLAVGLVVLGLGFVMPQSFTSEAILALPTAITTTTTTNATINTITQPTISPAQAVVMMVSPLVLDPVIESLNLSGGRPIQVARKSLLSQVKATVGKDGLLRLDTTAHTPQDAQKLANAIIDTWLKSTVPGTEDRADLEKRLESAKFSLESVDRLLKQLTTDGRATLGQPLTRGEAGTSIVAISELQSRFLGEVLIIPRVLKGFSRDVVKQPPTLPTEAVAPKKALNAVLATVACDLMLLLCLYARRAWRNLARDPASADKQARLLAALGLGARRHNGADVAN